MSVPKELHAWDKLVPPSTASYHMHFEGGQDKAVRGESTPSYAFHPYALGHISRYNPDMKLVFIMRDPVKRAISHLYHSMRMGETGDKSLLAELEEDIRVSMRPRLLPFRLTHRHYHARGLYHQQIKRMRRYFPERHIHLLRFEDFKSAPQHELARVCDFLEVERLPLPLHKKGLGKYHPPSSQLIDYLSNYYREPNRILAEEFGIRVDDWL